MLYFEVSYMVYAYGRFAETIDLNVTDPVAHKHTPYVVILVKIVEEWTKAHSGALPSTRDEKKEFKVYNQLTVYLLGSRPISAC